MKLIFSDDISVLLVKEQANAQQSLCKVLVGRRIQTVSVEKSSAHSAPFLAFLIKHLSKMELSMWYFFQLISALLLKLKFAGLTVICYFYFGEGYFFPPLSVFIYTVADIQYEAQKRAHKHTSMTSLTDNIHSAPLTNPMPV